MMVEQDDVTRNSIRAAIETLGSGSPIILVVASNTYAELLDNWLCHAAALDINRILIVAMDEVLEHRLAGSGYATSRGFFSGVATDFWLQRARIWSFLADAGIEFIHSDIDAVWRRNPMPFYAAVDFDILFTQGTLHPRDILKIWGFVLCTGFFWARPTSATSALFNALVTSPESILASDDQQFLNRSLARAGVEWSVDTAESYELEFRGTTFSCFTTLLSGVCRSMDLHIGLLPHHLFPRLQPGADDAMVRHVLRDEKPEHRPALMRAAGCWRLDAYPNGFAIRR